MSAQSKLVFIETFGCQMNVSDSERILDQLRSMDYMAADTPEEADLLLLNTCSIREKPEHKVYSTLGRFRLIKRERPGIIIGVGGCVAQQEGERLLKKMSYVDLVFGTATIHKLPMLLKEIESKRLRISNTELTDTIDPLEFSGATSNPGKLKSFVTIMRGCDNFCSYCIVPYVRGREISRDSKAVLSEITELAGRGVKEVTLVGQNVNSYGSRSGKGSFASLLQQVCKVNGIERVRFTTSHPKDLSVEVMDLFAEEEKLCHHIHLPVQSGSNDVLGRMNRGYTREDYLGRIAHLRRVSPGISITTDIIVGFPGETERDYMDTLDLLKAVRFDNIFSFMYSPRPGTQAASLGGRLDRSAKAERLADLQRLQRDITLEKNREKIGGIEEVLVEGISKSSATEVSGRTMCNRMVNFRGGMDLIGSTVKVVIEDAYANSLKGSYLRGEKIC